MVRKGERPLIMPVSRVTAEKEKALLERMNQLGLAEKDFEETFVRSSGPGGQKVKKPLPVCSFVTFLRGFLSSVSGSDPSL